MITGALAGTRSHRPGWRWLCYCALLLCCCCPLLASAIGLGDVRVHSNLGQPLRVTVPLLGGQADSVLQVCVKARLLTLDGTFISALRVTVEDGRTPQLALSSSINIQEPVVMLALEVACEAHISRDYQVLLDPPESLNLVAATAGNAGTQANPAASNSAANQTGNPANSANPANVSSTEGKRSKRKHRKAGDDIATPTSTSTSTSTPAASSPVRTASAPAAAVPAPDSSRLERRLSRESKRRARNVLKLDMGDVGSKPEPARLTPSVSGQSEAGLQLQLSRRLANDNSVVGNAAQEVFSDTVRQQQNQAVLIEVGRAEMKAMQQQIHTMEAELKRLKHGAAPAAVPVPEAGVPGALQAEKLTRQWILGLGLVLFFCLMAIAWLLWRLLQLRSKQQSFSAGLDLPKPPAPLVATVSSALEPAYPPPVVAKTSLLDKVLQKTGVRTAAQASDKPVEKPAARTPPAVEPAVSPRASQKIVPKEPQRPSHKPALRVEPNDEPIPYAKARVGSGAVSGIAAAPAPVAASAPLAAVPSSQDVNEMSFDFALAEKLEQEIRAEAEISKPWNMDEEVESSTPLLPPLQFRTAIDYATETEIPKVEELNDVMYEAEFWMSLNKIENAIRLLEQYTISDHGTSPLPWLFLFDLYHRTEQNEQYISLQRQFQRIFNGKIPDWDDYDQAQQSIGLEAMGSLMSRVETLWTTDEVIPFLESLLMDDRDGTREGFELGVYRDILFLCDLAKEVRKSDNLEKLSSVFNLEPME